MDQQPLPALPEDWTRAIAIVAHPDDLEYGASSAIAKWTAAGKEVVYVLATRGEAGIDAIPPAEAGPLREAEQRASGACVGVSVVEFLDHRDGVVEYGLPLRRDLARAIRCHQPEVVITGGFDLARSGGPLNQADHRHVGLAACDAARDAGNRWIFPELLAEGRAPWAGVRQIFISGGNPPTHACDVGDGIEAGIASLRAHRLYFENLDREFDPDSFLRGRAAEEGRRQGCQYAVAFRVIPL